MTGERELFVKICYLHPKIQLKKIVFEVKRAVEEKLSIWIPRIEQNRGFKFNIFLLLPL